MIKTQIKTQIKTRIKTQVKPLRRILAVAALVAIAWMTTGALAYPTPAPVPFRWELKFKAGDIRLYTDAQDGRSYWYFNYTVTNRTGRDRIWAPTLTLFTDAGEIMVSGREVPSRVTEDLLALLGNELLEEQNVIIGNLLHGRENARDGLVIWPARELKVNEITLFVSGISGESTRVVNPIDGETVTLHKTLQRNYLIRGNASALGARPVELIDETWIMR